MTDGDPLEAIDRLARGLLVAVERDDALEAETRREARRHLREIRAEVEATRLALFGPAALDGDPPGNRCGADDDLPLLVRRGPLSTSLLGPDPVAFERRRGDDDE